MGTTDVQIVATLIGVLLGGVLTIFGLYINDKLTRERNEDDTKQDVFGELLASRFAVASNIRDVRFLEITVFFFVKYDEDLQMLKPQPADFDKRHEHNAEQIRYNQDLREKYKDKMSNAYMKQMKLVTKTQRIFKTNPKIEHQCNKVLGLDFPSTGVSDDKVFSSIKKLENWCDAEKRRVDKEISDVFLYEMDRLIILVKNELNPKDVSREPETRFSSLAKGIKLVLKD